MQRNDKVIYSVDGDPAVVVKAERAAQLRKQMDESAARCDSWDSVRCDLENWTRRQRAQSTLPPGVTVPENVEEAQAETERYRRLVAEYESAQHDLNRERSAARQRLLDANRAAHGERMQAVAKSAVPFSIALQQYREVAPLFIDEGALHLSQALDPTEPASALRALLLDLVAHQLLDASAVPAIPQPTEKAAVIPARAKAAASESTWIPAWVRPALAGRR